MNPFRLNTVPRKMATATLRWMGAPESEVRMVEAMYKNTKGKAMPHVAMDFNVAKIASSVHIVTKSSTISLRVA